MPTQCSFMGHKRVHQAETMYLVETGKVRHSLPAGTREDASLLGVAPNHTRNSTAGARVRRRACSTSHHPQTYIHTYTCTCSQCLQLAASLPSVQVCVQLRGNPTHVIDAQLAPCHLPICCDAHTGWPASAGGVPWTEEVPAVASWDHHHH